MDPSFYPRSQAQQFWEDERPVLEQGQALLNRLERHGGEGGEGGWTLATKVPIVDNSGQVTGLVGVSRDITARMRAEAALRQSEARFRTAFAHAAIGMDLVDLAGRFLQVNAALCHLTGYTVSELLGRRGVPLGVLADATYPEGQARLQPGDSLVIYSDGLPDARPELQLDPAGIAAELQGLPDAQAMLNHLVALARGGPSLPDDLTIVVLHREASPATGASW